MTRDPTTPCIGTTDKRTSHLTSLVYDFDVTLLQTLYCVTRKPGPSVRVLVIFTRDTKGNCKEGLCLYRVGDTSGRTYRQKVFYGRQE